MRIRSWFSMALLMLVLPIWIVACGDDDDDDEEGTATPPAVTGEATTAATATEGAAAASATPESLTEATIVMNWFPEPEHGGYYYAANEGVYEAWNVDATIEPGGPGVSAITIVASGQADFGLANGDQIALARAEGIPVVALMAPFQINPQIIMVHSSSGIEDFDDIRENGTRVAVARAAAYAEYLVKEYSWDEGQLLTYNGQLAEWLNDESRATQGYLTTEPFYAREQGADPRPLLIAEVAGFNPYANILFTTEDMIENNPALVNAVVGASMEGWRGYLEDPVATHEYLLTLAPDLSMEGMQYNYDIMLEQLVPVGDAAEQGIGVMTAARWQELYDQLKSVDLVPQDLDPGEAWTDEFFTMHLSG